MLPVEIFPGCNRLRAGDNNRYAVPNFLRAAILETKCSCILADITAHSNYLRLQIDMDARIAANPVNQVG